MSRNGCKFYVFVIHYSFCFIVKYYLSRFSPMQTRSLEILQRFRLVFKRICAEFGSEVDINWLSVIMKSYCKVNLK